MLRRGTIYLNHCFALSFVYHGKVCKCNRTSLFTPQLIQLSYAFLLSFSLKSVQLKEKEQGESSRTIKLYSKYDSVRLVLQIQ